MNINFIRYENQVTGDTYYALADDPVKKNIDGADFIEVTNDLYNINKDTVFMVRADSLKRVGVGSRSN